MAGSSKHSLLFKLVATLIVLAPLSVSGQSFSEPAKYARLAITILIFFHGVSSGLLRAGPVSRALVAFVILFTVSSAWSGSPLWAILYKGMFAFMCLSGLILVNSVRTQEELTRGLTFLGYVATFTAFVALAVYLRNPRESEVHGRMAIAGLNSNTIGQTAGPLLVLCMYLALTKSSQGLQRMILGTACVALVLIILGSGSRGSLLMAGVGIMFLLLPHAKNPGPIIAIGVLGLLTLFVANELLELKGASRLSTEAVKNTRSKIWWWAFKFFLKSPVIGVGWVYYGRQWATVQSAFMQILAETGFVGCTLWFSTLYAMFQKCLSNQNVLRKMRAPQDLSYLTMAFLASNLTHGLLESSLVLGTSINSLFLGMGCAMADRCVPLVTARLPMADAASGPEPGGPVVETLGRTPYSRALQQIAARKNRLSAAVPKPEAGQEGP